MPVIPHISTNRSKSVYGTLQQRKKVGNLTRFHVDMVGANKHRPKQKVYHAMRAIENFWQHMMLVRISPDVSDQTLHKHKITFLSKLREINEYRPDEFPQLGLFCHKYMRKYNKVYNTSYQL